MKPASKMRIALREGIVLSVVALALALFYNGVTGKGVFSDAKIVRFSPPPGSAPEIISLEKAVEAHRSGALFVDSRHAFDFRLGHIAGAINIPLTGSDTAIARSNYPKDRTIVVYCDGAECNSSLEIGSKFSAAGFGKVFVFFAGWSAWKQAAMPLEADQR